MREATSGLESEFMDVSDSILSIKAKALSFPIGELSGVINMISNLKNNINVTWDIFPDPTISHNFSIIILLKKTK